MLMDTKQFCDAVRLIVVKKHKAKVRARYTFGTSGDSRQFTTFGKRKISFNCVGTNKQFNLIRKDLVKLFKGTWQQNFVKYKWFGRNKTSDKASDKWCYTNFRIEGTCTFADLTKEEFNKRMNKTLHDVAWGKLVA